MTDEKIKAAALSARGHLTRVWGWFVPREMTGEQKRSGALMPDYVLHALWMIDQIPAMVDGSDIDKAHRWLGFVQGVAWALGSATIEELKGDNREVADETI